MNEKRGNKPYYQPLGCIGIGLRVKQCYDNGNDIWIGNNNSPGEWCVAYHGVGRGQSSDNVKKITRMIYMTGFRQGSGGMHKNCLDEFHPGKTVGEGIYCTPKFQTAEECAGISVINGIEYKTILMVRVKPSSIRHCSDLKDFWVVNGTTDEIRPYRLLYKKN